MPPPLLPLPPEVLELAHPTIGATMLHSSASHDVDAPAALPGPASHAILRSDPAPAAEAGSCTRLWPPTRCEAIISRAGTYSVDGTTRDVR